MITEKNHITDPLPADVAALQALVRELRSELKISTLRGDRLEYKLRDLIRRLYGAKSEKLNPAQRLLFGILEETPIEEPLPPTVSNSTPTTAGLPKKKGGGRKPKPENLPIRRQLIDLPEEQKAGLVKIREELPSRSNTNRVASTGCIWCARSTRTRRRSMRPSLRHCRRR